MLLVYTDDSSEPRKQEAALALVESCRRRASGVVSSDDILGAIDLHRLHGFSIWDALVIRAAIQSGCTVLYSEDLQHRRRIDGLEIVNPF